MPILVHCDQVDGDVRFAGGESLEAASGPGDPDGGLDSGGFRGEFLRDGFRDRIDGAGAVDHDRSPHPPIARRLRQAGT